jgi:hypothetical protein
MIAEATRDGLALDAPAPDGPATASRVARFGPTTPKHPQGLPLALCGLDRL